MNVSAVEAPYAPAPLFTSHSVASPAGRDAVTVTAAVGCDARFTVNIPSAPASASDSELRDTVRSGVSSSALAAVTVSSDSAL